MRSGSHFTSKSAAESRDGRGEGRGEGRVGGKKAGFGSLPGRGERRFDVRLGIL